MSIDFGYFAYASLILVLGGVIGAGLHAAYLRSHNANDEEGIRLSKDDLLTIHWLATNGFHRLLLLGERGGRGFQTQERAELAHGVLDRLEYYLPKNEVVDASFNRMGKIIMRWPHGELSPAQRMLKQQQLNEEP